MKREGGRDEEGVRQGRDEEGVRQGTDDEEGGRAGMKREAGHE